MNKIIVIYHANCDDGFTAAWVAYRKFGNDAEYIPANYGDAPPDVKDKKVYILDFSYPREVVERMVNEAENLVLLDHHKTAMEQWGDSKEVLLYQVLLRDNFSRSVCGEVRFDMDHSGAMLAWQYFFPDVNPPILVRHVEDNDLWKFKIQYTKPFIRALRAVPYTFERWNVLARFGDPGYRASYEKFIEDGEAIEDFVKQQLQETIRLQGMHQIWLDNVKGLAINAPRTFASDLGNILATRSGTFGMVYVITNNGVLCSLRSRGDFDVSIIAKNYNGGGHKNAAAFTIDVVELQDLLSWGRAIK